MNRAPLIVWVLALLALTAAIGAGAGWYAYRAAMDRLAEQGRADLALATDRLASQLMRYRELAVILTSHPALQGLLFEAGDHAAADALLREMATRPARYWSGGRPAGPCPRLDRGGHRLARSARQPLARALAALGTAHDIVPGGAIRAQRVYSYARRSMGRGPRRNHRRRRRALDRTTGPATRPRLFRRQAWHGVLFQPLGAPLPARHGQGFRLRCDGGGNAVWVLDGGRYRIRASRARRAAISLQAHGRSTPGRPRAARCKSPARPALFLVFGAAMLVAVRAASGARRRLASRGRRQCPARARVTGAAGARRVNADLRREIVERKRPGGAQTGAGGTRQGRQALGAGPDVGRHQPRTQPALMAIRSFAENGTLFFERGNPRRRENIKRIAEQQRMGRIITTCAPSRRKRAISCRLGTIVEDALETTAAKLDRHGVTVDWTPPRTVRCAAASCGCSRWWST